MENFTNRLKVAIAALLLGLSAVVNAEDLEIVIGKIASGTTQSYDAGCMASGAKRRVYFRSNGPDNTSVSGYDGGSKMGSTSNIGSKLESGSKYYLKMTVETGEKITIYFYHTSTFTNKHINVSDSTNTTAYVEQIVVNNQDTKVLQSVEWTATFTGVAYFSTDNTMCFPAVVVPSNCYTGPKAPVLSISDNATQSVSQGNAISNIVVTSDKAATFNLAGSLPTGVSGTATDSKTYTISGSSNVIGNYTYSVTATADGLTSDAVSGTISVVEGPALNITNGTQEVMVGNAITNIVVTSDNPSTTFGVTGLPAGVTGSGSGSTYTISGTPTAEGTFNFVVSGTAGGNTKTVNGKITVTERQETSTNYTINTKLSAAPTTANGGIPAALSGATVKAYVGGSSWTSSGYKFGVNKDTLTIDLTNVDGAYITGASFPVTMGSTYTIAYSFDDVDNADDAVYESVSFGASGATATITCPSYAKKLRLRRNVGSGTTVGNILLTVATGVTLPPVLSISGNKTQSVSQGKAIESIVVTSDKPATFNAEGLPAGVSGNTSADGLTYTISGVSTQDGAFAYSVTATADGKTSVAVGGTLTVVQGPVLNITNASQTTTNGTAIKTIQITSNDGETTYSVSGLPSGVTGSGSGTSFAISGTPTAVGTFQYVVTGTLGGYSKTVNGTIIVQPAAPKLTASSNVEQEVQLNHAISTITITSDTAVSFSISCLPAGVVAIAGADSTRLIITGKATMLETTSFSVVAKAHGKGKQSNSISGQITVTEDAVAAAPVLTPSASSISVDKGVAITDLVITSDVTATWAIDKALPAGLTGTASADGLTYTISGTPTAVSASSVYTISATANELTAEQPITIAVNAVAPVVTAPSNATQNVALGEAIGNISFSSSDADAVFSVDGLPAGLTAVQDGSTYTISGTATAAGEFTYTVTAAVDGLSDSKTGKITVNEPVTYSVTFKDYDGTVLKQQTGILAGGFATAPATPTRTGYTFSGWDKSYSNVAEDLVVTATYTINTYTVTFKNWNGDVLSTQTVDYGAGATEPTVPAREGYEFIGWDKTFNNVMSDMIIVAQYEELSTPVAPSITVPDNATQTVALNENIEDITFEVDNTNAVISVTGLPDGVTYEQLGNTVVISGKPTESGTFTYVVKAEADGLASTKESVIIVEEQPENPTSVDETALNYSWKQTQNSVALEGVNVKIMTLYSESGARIKTVRNSNEINTSELVYGSRFIVVAVVEGKNNPIANKFIK